MAQSGPAEIVCCLSAFGAKRTCVNVWRRPPWSQISRFFPEFEREMSCYLSQL
jgi:hypothetical protein